MNCPACGGDIVGDGFSEVMRCENVDIEIVMEFEPDSDPVYCGEIYPNEKK